MNGICKICGKEITTTSNGNTCIECLNKPQPPNWINYGWICPVCGRGNSPYTSTCICRGYPKREVVEKEN